MKALSISLLLFMFFSVSIKAQDITEKKVKTEIESATIYLTAAEVYRTKTVNLKNGNTLLIFENISPRLNTKSIRVTTPENVDLLSVSSKYNYLTNPEELPRIKELKDSLELVNQKTEDIADETDALNMQKDLLRKNMEMAGKNTGLNITDLKTATDYYGQKIQEINIKLTKLKRQNNKFYKTKVHLQNELKELNASSNYSRAQIEILVSTKQTTNAKIEVKYIVNNAGWSPSYDIKATDTDKPVELIYRGKVYNNTGIAWKNINIKLSTADPTLSVTQPNLKPWYLKTYSTYSYNGTYKGNFQNNEGYIQNQAVISDDIGGLEQTEIGDGEFNTNIVGSDYSETAVPELSAEFNIDRKYSIPSDDKPYPVEISEHKLPATYKHFAVTKLDKDVFLLARIAGWEELNLVDGPANVYYSGTYLGQSFISTRDVKDTLDLSLGRDGKVLVTRTKLKEYSSTRLIGSKRRETLTYELVAKNNRKSDIDIEIQDQIPISQNEEIKVKVLETTDVTPDESTGELNWKFKLAPGKSKKIKISFYIEYPKNKTIEIQKKKSRQVRYKF